MRKKQLNCRIPGSIRQSMQSYILTKTVAMTSSADSSKVSDETTSKPYSYTKNAFSVRTR